MAEYTIDEVARLAGTNVRNVRSYQQRGLIPPPRREGRAGVYSDTHLARLKLIGRLLDRGYSLAHIDEMLGAIEQGRDVADLVGLERAITSPWTHEAPLLLAPSELAAMFPRSLAPNALAEALRLGVIRPEGDKLRVPSPRLLQAGVELVAAGLPLVKVLRTLVELREDMERVARRFVTVVDDELFSVYGTDRLPPKSELPRLADAVARIRPLALKVVEIELARALEDEIGAIMGDRIARIARTLDGEGASSAAKPGGSKATRSPARRSAATAAAKAKPAARARGGPRKPRP